MILSTGGGNICEVLSVVPGIENKNRAPPYIFTTVTSFNSLHNYVR